MIGPVELPFDGCPTDACADMITGDCPVEAGETVVYDLDFEVPDLWFIKYLQYFYPKKLFVSV